MNPSTKWVVAGLLLCAIAVATSGSNDWSWRGVARESGQVPRLVSVGEQLDLAAATASGPTIRIQLELPLDYLLHLQEVAGEAPKSEFSVPPDGMCRVLAETRL